MSQWLSLGNYRQLTETLRQTRRYKHTLNTKQLSGSPVIFSTWVLQIIQIEPLPSSMELTASILKLLILRTPIFQTYPKCLTLLQNQVIFLSKACKLIYQRETILGIVNSGNLVNSYVFVLYVTPQHELTTKLHVNSNFMRILKISLVSW